MPPLANPCRPGTADGISDGRAAQVVGVSSSAVLIGLGVVAAVGTGLYFLLRP